MFSTKTFIMANKATDFYWKVGIKTFYFSFLTNAMTTVCGYKDPYNERKNFLANYPGLFILGIVHKSIKNGFIWPLFYIEALHNPISVFCIHARPDKVRLMDVYDL